MSYYKKIYKKFFCTCDPLQNPSLRLNDSARGLLRKEKETVFKRFIKKSLKQIVVRFYIVGFKVKYYHRFRRYNKNRNQHNYSLKQLNNLSSLSELWPSE